MRGRSPRKIALLVAAACACVPSTRDDKAPHGAGGARFVPAAAARGTSFTTADGWTVTFERIAIVGLIDVQDKDFSGGSRFLVWDAMQEAENYVPALAVGTFGVKAYPYGIFLDPDQVGATNDPETMQSVTASNLTADVRSQVLAAADNAKASSAEFANYFGGPSGKGPAVIFAARGTRGDRSIRVALSLASAYTGTVTGDEGVLDSVEPIDVAVNDVRYAAFEVHPELIFTTSAVDTTLVFEPLATADQNGDGLVTGAELNAVLLPVAADAGADDSGAEPTGADATGADRGEPTAPLCSLATDAFACVTLLDRIADNAQRIIVPVASSH